MSLREDSGTSQAALARAAGIDPGHLCRIEAGTRGASLLTLARLAAALGADIGVRLFAGTGPRILDRFQAPMIEALIRSLDRRWIATPEVPVVAPARGVVDLVLHDPQADLVLAVEAHSEIRRLEQQLRWIAEKEASLMSSNLGRAIAAGSDVPFVTSRVLLLRSTVATRDLATRFAATFAAAFPTRTADALAALRGLGTPWPGPAIVWVRIDGHGAKILDGPPRGVSLGR